MFRSLPVIIMLAAFSLFAQYTVKPVASVGNETIGPNEFRLRFELTPRLGANSGDLDSTKKNFLEYLVAEKLWAMEASRMGFDTLELIRYSLRPIEKLLVRDALYKTEVESKIKLKPEELIRAEARSKIMLKVKILPCDDSLQGYSVYNRLKKGASFDSLLAYESTGETKLYEITYGDLEEESIEELLFQLKPGQITKPVYNGHGWFIFKMIDKDYRSETIKKSAGRLSPKEMLKERKAKIVGMDYMRKFFAGVTINSDKILFNSIVQRITPIIRKKELNKERKQNGEISLEESDIANMIASYSHDTLSMQFIKFDTEPMSLKDFLYSMSFDMYGVKESDRRSIEKQLNKLIRRIIQNELLCREGYRRRLEEDVEVKLQLKLWKDNFTSQLLKNRIHDTLQINDRDVEKYAEDLKHRDTIYMVNILEIYDTNFHRLARLRDSLKAGVSFEALAGRHTLRDSLKNRGGEFGFFPSRLHVPLGRFAARQDSGKVFGPVACDHGFSLVKVIGKYPAPDSVVVALLPGKDKLNSMLLEERMRDAIVKKTLEYARKYGANIFEDALKEVQVTSIVMFTHRIIGFGGRMAAYPYSSDWYPWFKDYQPSGSQNP